MPELWTPLTRGPPRGLRRAPLSRRSAGFAEERGRRQAPSVELELSDGSRFVIDRMWPEPGFGMVTLYVVDERDDTPDALVIPLGTIRRIELRTSPSA